MQGRAVHVYPKHAPSVIAIIVTRTTSTATRQTTFPSRAGRGALAAPPHKQRAPPAPHVPAGRVFGGVTKTEGRIAFGTLTGCIAFFALPGRGRTAHHNIFAPYSIRDSRSTPSDPVPETQ